MRRLLTFFIVTAGLSAGLLLAPREWQAGLFAGVALPLLAFGLLRQRGVWTGMARRGRALAQTVMQARRAGGWRVRAAALAALALAGAAFALSAWTGRPAHAQQLLGEALFFFLTGGILLGAAVWLLPEDGASAVPAPTPPVQRRVRRGALLAGVVCLCAAAELSGDLFSRVWLGEEWHVSHHVQFALFAGGTALVGWALAGRRTAASGTRRRGAPLWFLAGVVIVTAAAFAVRVYNVDEAIRVLVDEGHYVIGVNAFLVLPDVKLLRPMSGLAPFPWFYPYWQALALDAFGWDLFGFRFPSAVLGALTVPALVFMARALVSRPLALAAGVLLATFPPHMQFSRIGIIVVCDALVGCLLFGCLLRAMQGGANARVWWAWGGVLLGLSQVFYAAGRLFFPLLAFGWLGLLALEAAARSALRRRNAARRGGGTPRAPSSFFIAHPFMFLLAAALVAAPFYYVLGVLDAPLNQRAEETLLAPLYWQQFADAARTGGDLSRYLERIALPFTVYTARADTSRYYAGHEPMVLSVFVPLLLAGGWVMAAGTLRGERRRERLLLGLWVVALPVGNILLVDGTLPARYIVVHPVLCLLLALGAAGTAALIFRALRWRGRGETLVLLVAVLMAAAQVAFYFGPQLRAFNQYVRAPLAPDTQDAALRALNLPPTTQVFIVTGNPGADTYYPSAILKVFGRFPAVYLLGPDGITDDLLRALPVNQPYAFFVEPGDWYTPMTVRRYFHLYPPGFSPNRALPLMQQMLLYFAPGDPGARR